MSALALLLFLATFYVYPLYELVWRAAPRHLPRLVLVYNGRVLWNGAFYLEMLLWWLLFLGLAALFEWATKRDDPEWAGLFAGFERRAGLGVADLALLLLFPALILHCVLGGYPVHGPLSAGIAVLGTLVMAPLGAALGSANRARLVARTSMGASTDVGNASLRPPAPAGPDPEARPLAADEPQAV
jgi:hypothetical protein